MNQPCVLTLSLFLPFSLFLLFIPTQFRFDLYAHSWLVLEETEQISTTDGTVVDRSSSSVVDADGGRRTAGGGSSLLPSSWRQHGSSSQSSKYNSVGVRSGTPIQQKLSASAASLLLTGFATISEKTETVPWR